MEPHGDRITHGVSTSSSATVSGRRQGIQPLNLPHQHVTVSPDMTPQVHSVTPSVSMAGYMPAGQYLPFGATASLHSHGMSPAVIIIRGLAVIPSWALSSLPVSAQDYSISYHNLPNPSYQYSLMSHSQYQPPNLFQIQHRPIRRSRVQHQPTPMPQGQQQPANTSQTQHQPTLRSQVLHQPTPMPQSQQQPASTSQTQHQPTLRSQVLHQPTPMPQSQQQPASTSQTQHRPTLRSQVLHQPTPMPQSQQQPASTSQTQHRPTLRSQVLHQPTPMPQSQQQPASTSQTQHRPTLRSQVLHQPTPMPQSQQQPASTSQTQHRPTLRPQAHPQSSNLSHTHTSNHTDTPQMDREARHEMDWQQQNSTEEASTLRTLAEILIRLERLMQTEWDNEMTPAEQLNNHYIKMLPCYRFSSETVQSKSCTVCMDDYEEDQLLRVLPCFHQFHVQCVDRWLQRNLTCPLCRLSVIQTDNVVE